MKTLMLMLVLTTAAFAASWDGTHGNLTVSTIGDQQHTVISVSDINQDVPLYSVVVIYTEACGVIGCMPISKTAIQYVPRFVNKRDPMPSVAVFSIPLSQITSVVVTEFRAGQAETFGLIQP